MPQLHITGRKDFSNTPYAFKSTDFLNVGVPLVRQSNLAGNRVALETCVHLPRTYLNEYSQFRISKGDILIGMSGSIGKLCTYDSDIVALQNQRTGKIEMSRTGTFHEKFLWFYLQTIGTKLREKAKGIAILNVSGADIESLELPLAPLAEQKRIADKLEAVLGRVDACHSRLDRVPVILKRFRQSVLAAATSGRLTEQWRENSQASEWESVKVGDLCLNSFYGPRFGKDEYTTLEGGIPTIRTTDMTRGGVISITEKTPRVLVDKDKLEHFRAQKGDLLITRTGSIGTMAVFNRDIDAVPSAYLMRFRFCDRILPRYMFFCLMSPNGQESLGISTTSVAQPNINAEAIRSIPIKLPSVLEQQEIVRRLEALFAFADRIEASLAKVRGQVERLTPAVLAKAFRGELVPQDPNDEPASVLLERIRAQSRGVAKPTRRKAKG